jgi:hypothetical protein
MTTPAPGLIELRLNNVGQLFNTMDPSPFHERDLDHDAEEFILSWAREHESDSDLRIRIVLRQPEDAESARLSIISNIGPASLAATSVIFSAKAARRCLSAYSSSRPPSSCGI